jgi:hypothetical protein
MRGLRTAIHSACRVHNTLPCAVTSIIGGDDIRFFCARGENTIHVRPVQLDGTRASFVMAEDVCLTALNSESHPVSVCAHIRLDSGNGDIIIAYMLDGAGPAPKEMHVRVRICGVLLVDVCVLKTFSAHTRAQLHSKHVLEHGSTFYVAFHPAGTHVAITSGSNHGGIAQHCVNVYTLPDLTFVEKWGKKGSGKAELHSPHGSCFTEAGTLLVVDRYNARVQHCTLGGKWIATYSMTQVPQCVASCGDTIAVGGASDGVHVFSQKSGHLTDRWLFKNTISAIMFTDATTLVIATLKRTVGLYTLKGAMIRNFASDLISYGLAACADGCLLVSDFNRCCVRVFSTTGGNELVTAPFSAFSFERPPLSIGLYLDRAYVFEQLCSGAPRVCVFE